MFEYALLLAPCIPLMAKPASGHYLPQGSAVQALTTKSAAAANDS
jgi:hypothetical protein